MTQWARWLPKHGWRPIIVCRNYGFSSSREEISELIHPDAEVIYLNDQPEMGEPGKQPSHNRIRSAAIRMLGSDIVGARPQNMILRSTKGVMTKFLASRGQAVEAAFWRQAKGRIADLVRLHRPDVVITSSPPVATHDVGLHLKREFPDLQWLADFRDVFRQGAPYHVSAFRSYKSYKSLQFETSIYRTADRIICTVPAHQRWIRRRFPEVANKTAVVFNGAPEELCARVREEGIGVQDNSIKVIGFSEARESIILAQALANLRKAGESINLNFVGRHPSIKREIERILGDGVVFTGQVSHFRALDEIVSARVLVAVLSESRSRIPAIASKLFEYLAVPAPVVVINPSNAARSMFARLAGIQMLRKPTPAYLQAALLAALRVPEDELRARAFLVQEKWSRRSQAKQLASTLDDLVEKRDLLTEAHASVST